MSSGSWTNFAVFTAICGAAHLFHVYSTTRNKIQRLKENSSHQASPTDQKVKLVVISGCDRGFGYLLANQLLKETDYLVLALALTENGVDSLKGSVEGTSAAKRLFVEQCDVTSVADIERIGDVVQGILSKNDAVLFALVNNAGMSSAGDFLFFETIDMCQKVMDVNYFGQLRLTRKLLPTMMKTSGQLAAKRARIINLSSVCGVSASPGNSLYNASKFAVEAWSDSLRLELEPFGIHVVKIRPGQTNTQIQKDWATSYLENFSKADPFVQKMYGGADAFLEKAKTSLSGMGDGSAAHASLVIDALVKILTKSHWHLKAAYFTGDDAHTFWRAMSTVPTSVADTVKRLIHIKPVALQM